MAISAIGISGGGFVISPAAGWFIENYDWRVAWIFLGILMIVSIIPAGALFMRCQPEDLGMSAEEAASTRSAPGAGILEYSWTLSGLYARLQCGCFWGFRPSVE